MTVKAFAKVLIINDAGEILCLRRSASDGDRPGGWDFPGGTLEAGEGFRDAVARETQEEAGMRLSAPFLAYSKCEVRAWGPGVWLYYVEYVRGRPDVRLSFEHDKAEWFTPEAFLAASDHPKHHEIITFLGNAGLLTPTPEPAVGTTGRAVVVNPAGELLMLRRSSSDPFHGGSWDLPGGRAEAGEDIHETALREAEEEAGVALGHVQPVFAITRQRGEQVKTWVFFKADIAADTAITLSDEHDDFQWIAPAALPSYTGYEVLLEMGAFVSANHILERTP